MDAHYYPRLVLEVEDRSTEICPPGADDNASAVAVLLELARALPALNGAIF